MIDTHRCSRWLTWLLLALAASTPASFALCAPSAASQAATLSDAWLAYNARNQSSSALYSFISLDGTDAAAVEKKTELLDELDQLGWRLDNIGRSDLLKTVRQWQARLQSSNRFRLPGRWDLASVLSKPLRVPPLARVAAIGSCSPPDWIEVWDSRGVNRYAWHSGQALSSLLDERRLRLGNSGRVALVTPSGVVRRFGLRAWNFADQPLVPGTRVVASLPLSGEAFPWLRDAIARFLAYVPAGDACVGVSITQVDRPQ